MAKLDDLSLADIKASLDFARELKADTIMNSKFVVNDRTIELLTDLEEKLRWNLFIRVNKLTKYD